MRLEIIAIRNEIASRRGATAATLTEAAARLAAVEALAATALRDVGGLRAHPVHDSSTPAEHLPAAWTQPDERRWNLEGAVRGSSNAHHAEPPPTHGTPVLPPLAYQNYTPPGFGPPVAADDAELPLLLGVRFAPALALVASIVSSSPPPPPPVPSSTVRGFAPAPMG